MPAERFEIRIPAHKLLLAMFVIIIPIFLAAHVSPVRTDSGLERTPSAQFNVAIASAAVDTFAASIRKYQVGTDSFSAGEATWTVRAAAHLLPNHLQDDPALLRVKVTHIRAAVAASTHKTVNYFQGDSNLLPTVRKVVVALAGVSLAGRRVIGVAGTGCPKFLWVVSAAQTAKEAIASIRGARRIMAHLRSQPRFDNLAGVAPPARSHYYRLKELQ